MSWVRLELHLTHLKARVVLRPLFSLAGGVSIAAADNELFRSGLIDLTECAQITGVARRHLDRHSSVRLVFQGYDAARDRHSKKPASPTSDDDFGSGVEDNSSDDSY
eukprot:INCI17632.4.p1 GENE.INCI17632.4~~INCI17632.4.p1  ORF type:complete len:107 (+),score=25.60 INCI17632.4:124-444(+)